MENGAATETCVQTEFPSQENQEVKKLLVFKVYKRRWLVLLVLCLLNCSNATVSSLIVTSIGYHDRLVCILSTLALGYTAVKL